MENINRVNEMSAEEEYLASLEGYDYFEEASEIWDSDCRNASYTSDDDDFSDIKPYQIYVCSDVSMSSSTTDLSDTEMSPPPSPLDTSRFRHCFLKMGDEMEL